jgi:hypothetical protein
MRRTLTAAITILCLAGFAAPAALGARNPAGTGQPGTANPNGVSCPSTITSPPGFNSGGFANAATHYAGSPGTPSAANGSPHAVSEYDIACYQTSQH